MVLQVLTIELRFSSVILAKKAPGSVLELTALEPERRDRAHAPSTRIALAHRIHFCAMGFLSSWYA
jgi:hypothetical protein